jgi:hypothetical protein
MMNSKGRGRNQGLSQHLPERTKEKHENVYQNSLSSSRYLNPGPLEYDAGVLTTQP